MKKLFTAIRHSDFGTVKELLEKKPDLLSCTAKQPPKKDDGQSPLQVAIKTGNFEIAEYLLDLGADVNFMETEGCNEWKMPVIQDAIMAAVMNVRYNSRSWDKSSWEYHNTKERADRAFNLLKQMFDMGAGIDAFDSYGNSCLVRAILDAKRILPAFNYAENKMDDNRLLTDELKNDLARIFDLLIQQGADINEADRISGRPLCEYYAKEAVAQFLVVKDKKDKKGLLDRFSDRFSRK